MALTTEQLVLQADILASKTDSATNPNMAYKTSTVLNKGLNPDIFSGNNTKIVNAINMLAANANVAIDTSTNVANKVNDILLDTNVSTGAVVWEETKTVMGEQTIIEGLQGLFSGNKQQQVLDLNDDDIGKFLTVVKDTDGIIRTSTMEVPGLGQAVKASEVVFENPDRPEFTTVESVLLYLLENQGSGGGSGETVVGNVKWEDILNKPSIVTGISITDDQVCLQAGDEVVASIGLVTDNDIELILNSL